MIWYHNWYKRNCNLHSRPRMLKGQISGVSSW